MRARAFRSGAVPLCSGVFLLCRRCDRRYRYCSPECSALGRRMSARVARKNHQESPEGKLDHRDRQARAYRARFESRRDGSARSGSGQAAPVPRVHTLTPMTGAADASGGAYSHVDPFVAAVCRAGAGGPARVRLMLSEPMAGTSLKARLPSEPRHERSRWCCSWRRWRSGTASPCTLSSMPTPWTRAATRSVGRACWVIRPSRTCEVEWLGVPGVQHDRFPRPRWVAFQPRGAWCLSAATEAAMISQEIRAEIRRLVLRDGWKVETVARRFGVHHSVVRRMIQDGAPLDGRRAPKRLGDRSAP